jgi:hypothetical protein
VTKMISRSCIHCSRLGNCKTATAQMIREDKGCGDWSLAEPIVIAARYEVRDLAGDRAIEAMLIKDPPSTELKPHRSK